MVGSAARAACRACTSARSSAQATAVTARVLTALPADENPPRLDGARIYGLGASDMKCADALILHLLDMARTTDSPFDLAAILYAREEGPFEESGFPQWVPWLSPLVCLTVLVLGYRFFNAGLRRYESTGS